MNAKRVFVLYQMLNKTVTTYLLSFCSIMYDNLIRTGMRISQVEASEELWSVVSVREGKLFNLKQTRKVTFITSVEEKETVKLRDRLK